MNTLAATKREPPKRQPGQGRGRRNVDGYLLGIPEAAKFLGVTEKALRGKVAKGQLPTKIEGTRIYFLKHELKAYYDNLPGVSVEEALNNSGARR